MCVIYLSYQQDPYRPLLIVANRDEYYERPTKKAHFWEEDEDILGGKDLKSGGTWFAIHRDGRWIILTNYRDPSRKVSAPRSRGLLLKNYLLSKASAENFAEDIKSYTKIRNYEGFSLLWGDLQKLYFYSNIEQKAQELTAGLYGLSNHLLDTPWPKIVEGKKALAKLLQKEKPPSTDALFSFLQDPKIAEDAHLPDTGVGMEWERVLSARFICSPEYGTRASTLFHIDTSSKAYFAEQSYGREARQEGRQEFSFPLRALDLKQRTFP